MMPTITKKKKKKLIQIYEFYQWWRRKASLENSFKLLPLHHLLEQSLPFFFFSFRFFTWANLKTNCLYAQQFRHLKCIRRKCHYNLIHLHLWNWWFKKSSLPWLPQWSISTHIPLPMVFWVFSLPHLRLSVTSFKLLRPSSLHPEPNARSYMLFIFSLPSRDIPAMAHDHINRNHHQFSICAN